MLNHQTDSAEQYSQSLELGAERAGDGRESLKRQQYINEHLRQTARRTLIELGHEAGGLAERSLRRSLVYISGKYAGSEARRFAHYCRALHLMSQQQFRAALTAFESVLVGQVEADFVPLRKMALELHSLCLEELEFDDSSMEQFTQLLYRKFEEARSTGQPDDVARMLGLGGSPVAMPL